MRIPAIADKTFAFSGKPTYNILGISMSLRLKRERDHRDGYGSADRAERDRNS